MTERHPYTPIGVLLRHGKKDEAKKIIFAAFRRNDFRRRAVADDLKVKLQTVNAWLHRYKDLHDQIREAQLAKARKALDTK